MISAGIAVAGLGLIGAGAGATFTAQVSTSSQITSGGLELSLNGKTGSDVKVDLDAKNLGSHFRPVSSDFTLKNTGSLDMVSLFLEVKATGCDGGADASLARALRVRVIDVAALKDVFDGDLCSLNDSASGPDATSKSAQGFISPPAHAGVGGQLPHPLNAGESILYRIVIQPSNDEKGLPTAAQKTNMSVNLVFSGFDY
jgi:hypothetical protein